MNGELGILRRPVRPICSGTPRCFTRCADAMPNCGSGTGGVYVVAAGDGFLMTPRYRVYLFTRRPHGAFFYLQALDTQERIIGFAARFLTPR